MTGAERCCAHRRFRADSIGADAGLRVGAPEAGVAWGGRGDLLLGEDELPLPAQRATQVWTIDVETLIDGVHASSFHRPAAFSTARFTATRVSWSLYALWLSGLALLTAA